MDRHELEALAPEELHDRALGLAGKRLDVAFLWRLVKAVPVAEAASGNLGAAEADVVSLITLVNDVVHSGEGEVSRELRPLYIDYLEQHG